MCIIDAVGWLGAGLAKRRYFACGGDKCPNWLVVSASVMDRRRRREGRTSCLIRVSPDGKRGYCGWVRHARLLPVLCCKYLAYWDCDYTVLCISAWYGTYPEEHLPGPSRIQVAGRDSGLVKGPEKARRPKGQKARSAPCPTPSPDRRRRSRGF
jgi:hypothetical protein